MRGLHVREALMEAFGLGAFMVSASLFATLLELPTSPVHAAIPDPFARRLVMGLAMGATAVAIITSPWGKRSGAHINPAVTLTFLRLGKVTREDAALYVPAQLLGGVAGMLVSLAILRGGLADPAVGYIATVPGPTGRGPAFAAEAAMSFLLMATVLVLSSHERRARFTPWAAGALVALFIAFEAPISGMSINPARTFGSAVVAGRWDAFWIYVAAPLVGMLAAAQVIQLLGGALRNHCAKLDHARPCIFCGAEGEAP